jgi:integrase
MATRWGWLDTNPVTALNKKALKESRPRTRFITREEFARHYNAASEDLKPVLVVAFETGLRKEELLGLKIGSIDFRRRELHLEMTKTNTPRRIPLSGKALETIREILEQRSRPRSVLHIAPTSAV